MNEIFRHLRPQIRYRNLIKNDPKGGISFLAIREGQIADYWVYICPLDTIFSHKAAILNLRKSRSSGTKPWGRIVLDGSPLIQNLCESASSQTDLYSGINLIIKKIISTYK